MFDDLKRLAGVHVGATPLKFGTKALNLKLAAAPAPATSPSAPVLRSLGSHPLAPVQRPAPPPAAPPALKLGASTSTSVFREPIAAIAPTAAAPPALLFNNLDPNAAKAATPAALATIAAAAGIAAPAARPTTRILPTSIASMLGTNRLSTAPSKTTLRSGVTTNGAGGSVSGTGLVSRPAQAKTDDDGNTFRGGATDGAAGGFNKVERSARPAGTGTTKGRSIMATKYQGTGEITYCPINSAGIVNAGAQVILPASKPSKPFQGQRLCIDPTLALFNILDIKLGNEPVAVTAGAVSAGNFPPANGPKFEWKVADGVDIIFTVSNGGTVSVAFSAMIVGEICEAVA